MGKVTQQVSNWPGVRIEAPEDWRVLSPSKKACSRRAPPLGSRTRGPASFLPDSLVWTSSALPARPAPCGRRCTRWPQRGRGPGSGCRSCVSASWFRDRGVRLLRCHASLLAWRCKSFRRRFPQPPLGGGGRGRLGSSCGAPVRVWFPAISSAPISLPAWHVVGTQ